MKDEIENPVTWRNVLHTKAWLGNISVLHQHAVALGYPYMMWNDHIYRVEPTDCFYTGLTINNLPK